jgi:phage/plasmid-associated DNA primase
LSGVRQEKLFMANGGGRNGKGLLNELMMECVGFYGQKLNMCVITDKIKGGANAEVSNLHKKRWVVANEPNDDEIIKTGNIKRLTGDERIDARGLYKDGKQPTILCLTFVIELNKMIALQGRIDDAIVERLVKVDFTSFFTTNEYQLKHNPNAKLGNPDYKSQWWKAEYRHAFFKYLLDSPTELYICEEAKNSAKEYLLNNDDMYNWFIDNYEKIEEPTEFDYVTIKDIYELWKCSDLYSNMNKAQKRKANMKHFKQSNILENNEMKKYYVEEYQKYKDGKRYINKSNVLVNWKKKCKLELDE